MFLPSRSLFPCSYTKKEPFAAKQSYYILSPHKHNITAAKARHSLRPCTCWKCIFSHKKRGYEDIINLWQYGQNSMHIPDPYCKKLHVLKSRLSPYLFTSLFKMLSA